MSYHFCVSFPIIMGNQPTRPSTVRVSDTSDGSRPSNGGGLARSRSIRANADHIAAMSSDDRRHNSSKPSEPRYLPRGLDAAHNGINIPRMPYGHGIEPANSNDGGYESPQWGWFLRTTPPTPQMYYPRPVVKHSGYGGVNGPSDASLSSSSQGTTEGPLTSNQPNPVFQGLQVKHQAAPMGWSSVPL